MMGAVDAESQHFRLPAALRQNGFGGRSQGTSDQLTRPRDT
jgi:hypothetical protein